MIIVQSTLLRSVEEKDGIRYDSDFSRIEELIKGNTFTRYFSDFGACPSFSVESLIFGDFAVNCWLISKHSAIVIAGL